MRIMSDTLNPTEELLATTITFEAVEKTQQDLVTDFTLDEQRMFALIGVLNEGEYDVRGMTWELLFTLAASAYKKVIDEYHRNHESEDIKTRAVVFFKLYLLTTNLVAYCANSAAYFDERDNGGTSGRFTAYAQGGHPLHVPYAQEEQLRAYLRIDGMTEDIREYIDKLLTGQVSYHESEEGNPIFWIKTFIIQSFPNVERLKILYGNIVEYYKDRVVGAVRAAGDFSTTNEEAVSFVARDFQAMKHLRDLRGIGIDENAHSLWLHITDGWAFTIAVGFLDQNVLYERIGMVLSSERSVKDDARYLLGEVKEYIIQSDIDSADPTRMEYIHPVTGRPFVLVGNSAGMVVAAQIAWGCVAAENGKVEMVVQRFIELRRFIPEYLQRDLDFVLIQLESNNIFDFRVLAGRMFDLFSVAASYIGRVRTKLEVVFNITHHIPERTLLGLHDLVTQVESLSAPITLHQNEQESLHSLLERIIMSVLGNTEVIQFIGKALALNRADQIRIFTKVMPYVNYAVAYKPSLITYDPGPLKATTTIPVTTFADWICWGLLLPHIQSPQKARAFGSIEKVLSRIETNRDGPLRSAFTRISRQLI
jgi:hypothetical protein